MKDVFNPKTVLKLYPWWQRPIIAVLGVALAMVILPLALFATIWHRIRVDAERQD